MKIIVPPYQTESDRWGGNLDFSQPRIIRRQNWGWLRYTYGKGEDNIIASRRERGWRNTTRRKIDLNYYTCVI